MSGLEAVVGTGLEGLPAAAAIPIAACEAGDARERGLVRAAALRCSQNCVPSSYIIWDVHHCTCTSLSVLAGPTKL